MFNLKSIKIYIEKKNSLNSDIDKCSGKKPFNTEKACLKKVEIFLPCKYNQALSLHIKIII